MAEEPIPMGLTISMQPKFAAKRAAPNGIAPKKMARKSAPLCAKAWRAALAAAFVPVLLLIGFRPLTAQAPVSTPKSDAGQKPVHHHIKPSAVHPLAPAPEVTYAPLMPPAPVWPANDQPVQASIIWDSKGLLIDAKNSSLEQILNDVSTATGTQVEGLDTDERVFGVYGPGQARDVLSDLLHGSSYNVMMIGDQGQGTPRRILLSVRHAGDAHPATPNRQTSTQADDEPEPEEPQPGPQPPPPPNRNVFSPIGPGGTPGASPRTPQQVMEELQQRQQNQQNQQPNQQPANPQN
jgi:hypothetical protein